MAKTAALLSPDLPTRYLQTTRKIGLLTLEREQELVRRWQAEQDVDARNEILVAHQLIIQKALRRFSYTPNLRDDLLQEGNFGLMEALDKFDPTLGYRFSSFCYMHVFAALKHYARKNRGVVRFPRPPDSYLEFAKARNAAGYRDRELDIEGIEKIAEAMNLGVNEIYKILNKIPRDEFSLNVPLKSDRSATWQDWLLDDRLSADVVVEFEHASALRQEWLCRAMEKLKPREQHIIQARRLSDEPLYLEALSQIYGVSLERIRQIEEGAIRKISIFFRREFPFQRGALFYDPVID